MNASNRLQPGGFTAISRGLSAATPPVSDLIQSFASQRDASNFRSDPAGVAAIKPSYRGRRRAQPPANSCQASGLITELVLRLIRAPLDSRDLKQLIARIKDSANESQNASRSPFPDVVQELLQ